jgi:hypothetical protein
MHSEVYIYDTAAEDCEHMYENQPCRSCVEKAIRELAIEPMLRIGRIAAAGVFTTPIHALHKITEVLDGDVRGNA